MNYDEMRPFILGKQKNARSTAEMTRVSVDQIESVNSYIAEHEFAIDLFEAGLNPAAFTELAVDMREEFGEDVCIQSLCAIYAGKHYTQIPDIFTYYVQLAFKEAHGIPNLVYKALPSQIIKASFQEGFFLGDVSPAEAVSTIIGMPLVPVDSYYNIAEHDTWSEVYISSTDMVAAIPNAIVKSIASHVHELTVDKKFGIMLADKPIRCLGGYLGATDSIYDLRTLL